MEEKEFKNACKNYLSFYKTSARQDLINKPTSLLDDEQIVRYMIKSKASSTENSIKLNYLTRTYLLKKGKVSFNESTKSFSVKKTKKVLQDLPNSDKEYMALHATAIVAYIAKLDITPDYALDEIKLYLDNAEQDPLKGQEIILKEDYFSEQGIITKNSKGTIKQVKKETAIIIFKEIATGEVIEQEIPNHLILYLNN